MVAGREWRCVCIVLRWVVVCGCAEWWDVWVPERSELKPVECEWRGRCGGGIECDGKHESEPGGWWRGRGRGEHGGWKQPGSGVGAGRGEQRRWGVGSSGSGSASAVHAGDDAAVAGVSVRAVSCSFWGGDVRRSRVAYGIATGEG